ncbi:MAG: hydrogenase maturation protease [Nitrospirae bacterium]|nr:hydrogenase maturation protease [Nitrospirota bacterium]
MTDDPRETDGKPATGTLVLALGHPFAGDDGAGIAVVETLKQGPLPPDVRVVVAQNPADLFHLLPGVRKVIVVDAVTGYGQEGEIFLLPPDLFMETRAIPVSSHGLGVLEALRIAQIVKPEDFPQQVMILGIAIRSPQRFTDAFSPLIQKAIPRAVRKLSQTLGLQEIPDAPDSGTVLKGC